MSSNDTFVQTAVTGRLPLSILYGFSFFIAILPEALDIKEDIPEMQYAIIQPPIASET
jgi:hypothetical protein